MDVVVLAVLAMVSVCLWTLRVAATTRGLRLVAPPLAAVEAIVYVTAFSQVMADLGSLDRLLGFGSGVAAGTFAAMLLADRLEDASSAPRSGRQRDGRAGHLDAAATDRDVDSQL